MIRVATVKNPYAPLSTDCALYAQPMTVAAALELHPMQEDYAFVCVVNGVYVLREDDWSTYMVPDGGVCQFLALAAGGGGEGGKKNPLAMVLLLVVAIAAMAAVASLPAAGVAGWTAPGLIAAKVGIGLAAAGASFLINLALPPSFPKPPEAPDPAYDITSRSNQARLGAPQEVGYGRTKFFPSICAAPFREFSDSFLEGTIDSQAVGDQTLFEIYNIGWGYYDIEGFEFLEQPLENVPEVVIQKFEPGERVTSFPTSSVVVEVVENLPMPFALEGSASVGAASVSTLREGGINRDEVGINEQQAITLRRYDGGFFRISWSGETSGPINWDATAEQVQAALVAMSVIGTDAAGRDNVICTDGPLSSSPVLVEFVNDLGQLAVAQMAIDDTDDLVDAEDVFPYWGEIIFGGGIAAGGRGWGDVSPTKGITDSGTQVEADGTVLGWIEVPLYAGWFGFGVTDALAGKTLLFISEEEDDGTALRNNEALVAVTIHSNSTTKLYWEIPASDTYLRWTDSGNPVLARTIYSPTFNGDDQRTGFTYRGGSFYEVVEINNWVGPYKINPTESSDEINQIAIDIAIPDGRYVTTETGDKKSVALGWRFEYQELNDDGEPLDALGATTKWKPLTTDPAYIVANGAIKYPPANILLVGKSTSPTRFTVKVPVPDGRYQIRGCNTFMMNTSAGLSPGISNETTFGSGGWAPSRKYHMWVRVPFSSMEDGQGSFGKSNWAGLRGFGSRDIIKWDDRTIVTVRITATSAINSSNLTQFSVLATRKLQDYTGPISSGTLATNPFTTWVMENVQTARPTITSIAKSQRNSTVYGPGIGAEFSAGEYVRLTGFTGSGTGVDGDGEYLVLVSTPNALTVRANLSTRTSPGLTAGSRRVRCAAPLIMDSVGLTAPNKVTATGIGTQADFAVGAVVSLVGFTTTPLLNNGKFTILSRTANELTVDGASFTTETAAVGKQARSVPPNGMVGELLDGALMVLTGATDVGGIAAASLNSVSKDNCTIAVDENNITTLTATGIAAAATVGGLVSLTGFTDKRNQETVVVRAKGTGVITVATPESKIGQPIPLRSSLVAEAGASGKKAVFGARPVTLTGDNEFYFFADEGATSAATGGGTPSYEFPNTWTGLQPSRRISSAAYDLVTSPLYGGGVSADRFNTEDFFLREQTWNARDRYEADGITWKVAPIKDRYDIRLSDRKLIHDILTEMARCGRARPMYPSGALTFIRDEPRPVADGMYTGHNIVGDSLEISTSFPTDDTPDHILVQFFNEEYWDYDEIIATDIPYSTGQTIRLFRATGGTFTLSYKGESTTLNYDDSEATVIAALEALSTVPSGAFDAGASSGTLGTGLTLVYSAEFLATNPQKMVAVGTLLTGTSVRTSVVFVINPAWPGVAPARLLLAGVVQHQQAWREGMYELGSTKYRRMLVSFSTDVEGYIPSYLSRITLNDEIGSWGQHGVLTGYVDNGNGTASLFTSEPLEWGVGSYVMQLRDRYGAPVSDALTAVTQGDLPNEAVMVGVFDDSPGGTIGIHTDHNVGREATFYSFGVVDNHALQLLVVGIRPNGKDAVGIEGYVYREEGVYDADGTLEYLPPTEEAMLSARRTGEAVIGLKARLVISNSDEEVGKTIRASWAPTPWAVEYLVETSDDEGTTWRKIAKTSNSSIKFTPEEFVQKEVIVDGTRTVGEILGAGIITIIERDLLEPQFVPGAHTGQFVRFESGPQRGREFKITNTRENWLDLAELLAPAPNGYDAGPPIVLGDDYDIIRYEQPTLWVSVRGYNVVYGPRTYVDVDISAGAQGTARTLATLPDQHGQYNVTTVQGMGEVNEAYEIVSDRNRTDSAGNLFIGGKVFDANDPTRSLYIGEEAVVDGADTAVFYLPRAPRQNADGSPSLLVFDQDSAISYVASSPGEGEYTLAGRVGTLGYARNQDSHIHFIMVSDEDDAGVMAGVRIGESITISNGSPTATLPAAPARPTEVLLFLNGDVLVPTGSGVGTFALSGGDKTTITAGFNFVTGDILTTLYLAKDRTTQADRFHCLPFVNSIISLLPLYPTRVAIAEGGSMRWQHGGDGNFQYSVYNELEILWGGSIQPVVTDTKYAVMLRAVA